MDLGDNTVKELSSTHPPSWGKYHLPWNKGSCSVSDAWKQAIKGIYKQVNCSLLFSPLSTQSNNTNFFIYTNSFLSSNFFQSFISSISQNGRLWLLWT